MITTLCHSSNTGISSMINLDDFLKSIELLETKGVDYALKAEVAMMAIAANARATDDYNFIGQRDDFECIEELSKISSDKNFGRYRHNDTIVDTLFTENTVGAQIYLSLCLYRNIFLGPLFNVTRQRLIYLL